MKFTALLLVGVALLATPASAESACNEDGYKVDHKGDRYPTPACQAQLIGSVARSHGVRVSNKQILRHPGARAWACASIGFDPRTEIACSYETGWYGQRR
jgi:hypothetical protein